MYTVSDMLYKKGLHVQKPKICVPLTRAAKCARLQFVVKIPIREVSIFFFTIYRRVTYRRKQNKRHKTEKIC